MDEIIVKNTSLPLTFTTVPCTLTSCEKAICPPTPKKAISDGNSIQRNGMNNHENKRLIEWHSCFIPYIS